MQQQQQQRASNFVRNSESSSSVRLRRRRDDPAAAGVGVKKRNRHSGDFVYWANGNVPTGQQQYYGGGPAIFVQPQPPQPPLLRNVKQQPGQYRQSGDWAFYAPYPTRPTTSHVESPVSLPMALVRPTHKQPTRVSNHRLLSEEEEERERRHAADCGDGDRGLMETLDRKIPPSTRPLAQETFSAGPGFEDRIRSGKHAADQTCARGADNGDSDIHKSSSSVAARQARRRGDKANRRSCDVSEYANEVVRRSATQSDVSDAGRRYDGGRRPVSVSATSLVNAVSAVNAASRADKRFLKVSE
jgi:hypothetical protein